MFGMGIWELLVILAIVLLLFGPKRLKTLGSDLGGAIKGFRSAVKEEEDKSDDRVIEGRVEQPGTESAEQAHKQDRSV